MLIARRNVLTSTALVLLGKRVKMNSPIAELSPITIQGLAGPTNGPLIPAGYQANVYNGDVFNTLLISHSTNPQLSNSIPIAPLTNGTVPRSTKPWYGAPLTGTIAQLTVSSAAQLSPSASQIQQQLQPSMITLEQTTSNAAGGTFPITPVFTGRLWAVSLTQSAFSNSTFTGNTSCIAQLSTSVTAQILAAQTIDVAGPSQQSNSVDNFALASPIPINNERINLVTQAIAANAGFTVTGLVYYSVP